jgi:hypothetical protein
MRRRKFIALMGASVIGPFAARAQQVMPTVGVMSTASPTTTTFGVLFPKLMKEFGWEENGGFNYPMHELVTRQGVAS